MDFNPPYNMDINFNGDMEAEPTETYTDKDGKVVTRQEIDDYSAWLEANPPAEEPAAITTSTEAAPTA